MTQPKYRQEEEPTLIPVVPSDTPLHSVEYPFCYDQTCPCHEEQENITEVHKAYQEGEFTAQEATGYVNGKMIIGRWPANGK